MTVGIVLPAFILSYFNMLDTGIILSTGALCVSVTDSAGPVKHRANGMFFCLVIIILASIATNIFLPNKILLCGFIVLMGFVCSMLNVYNARVSSVGLSGLLIMVLSMQTPLHGSQILLHTLYLVIGGGWYFSFSLLLYTLKPYKIIQQLLADFIFAVANYLHTRSTFYEDDPDYDTTYSSLLKQQVSIQNQQLSLTEMLFKTRAITKNSTTAGRSFLKIYIDVADLFESIMATYQQYEVLHKSFDETGILSHFRNHLNFLSNELIDIGTAVKIGEFSKPSHNNIENIAEIKIKFEELRTNFLTENNVTDFISLGRILENILLLTEKINSLHYYTHFRKNKKITNIDEAEFKNFNEPQVLDASLFINNLNLSSHIFRHSLRVSVSLFIGFLVSLLFNIGHSYWILLTIIVILKPAYSLTKVRNKDRLIGTVLGLILGVGLLFLIKSNITLLIIMIFFMIGCYMYIRTNYFVSVLLMTPYLVIFFHLIYPGDITSLLTDRLIDTAIGSAIAFIVSLFFIPNWEHSTIKNFMAVLIQKQLNYYTLLSSSFSINTQSKENLKKGRQQLLTALANVSDAFNRMLSEPKRFQKNKENVYQFLVLNHILTSHLSALAFYSKSPKVEKQISNLDAVITQTIGKLKAANAVLVQHINTNDVVDITVLQNLQAETNLLLQKRKLELGKGNLETDTKQKLIALKSVIDQFGFIYNLSNDILKNVHFIEHDQEKLA